MVESPEAVVWKQRWAPAYIWETLVRVRQFRLDAVGCFFKPTLRSNVTEMFSPEDPRSGYCVFCRLNQPEDCLFFQPELAAIFIDIIDAFGKTKMGNTDFVNADLIDQVIPRLPSLYEQLGHPSNNGFVWRCVREKLHQMFPCGVLMMEDIRDFLQKEYVSNELHLRRENNALIMSDFLQEQQELGIAPEEVTSTITDPEKDPQIMCGCQFYCEASCPVYDKYIETKSLCVSSQAFRGYTNRLTSLDDYLHLARLEVETDWERSPVCAHFRINMFLGNLHRNSYFEHKATEEKSGAVRKDRVAKLKRQRR
jgi:hypothetical protein